MPEAAIQEDVVTATERAGDKVDIQPVETPEIDLEQKMDREDAMSRILANRDKELEDEIGEGFIQEPAIEETIDAEPEVIKEEPELEPETIKIKVDGVESEVTEKEIREYQKHKAADMRLNDINKTTEDLAKRQVDIEAAERRIADREAEKAAQVVAGKEKADAIDYDALSDQIMSGVLEEDKAKVTEALRKMTPKKDATAIQVQPAQTLSKSDIHSIIDSRDMWKEQDKAKKKFAEDYPHIAGVKWLKDAVNERTKVEMTDDPAASVGEIISRAAKYIDNGLKDITGKEEEKPDPVKAELQARAKEKAQMGDSIKTAATAKSAITSKSDIPKLSAIEQIKKDRGQL